MNEELIKRLSELTEITNELISVLQESHDPVKEFALPNLLGNVSVCLDLVSSECLSAKQDMNTIPTC